MRPPRPLHHTLPRAMAYASPVLVALEPLLRTRRFGQVRRGFDAVGSTNTEALAWAAGGAPDGSLVLTEHQTAGRGRLGRTWHDAPGLNLLFSLVLRPPLPPDRLGLIPLTASLAVAEIVEAVAAPLSVAIKWPNDVLLDGRKCCGMLLEAALGAGRPTVVLGIGLNVNQIDFPPDVEAHATSLRLATGRLIPRAPLLADMLHRLEQRYDALLADPASLRTAYEERLRGRGDAIVLHPASTQPPVEGVLLGVDPGGALRVRTDSGVRTFHAGDVTFRS